MNIHPRNPFKISTQACVSNRPITTIAHAAMYSIAPFRFEITPPLHHALLGGLVKEAVGIDDSLEAIGYVLLGHDNPIVICVLDWAGLMNDSHLEFRRTLAEAADTTPERVALHCVHQHNTPFVCEPTRQRAALDATLPPVFDPEFFTTCLRRGAAAVRDCLPRAQPITHIAHGEAKVSNVASNRRIDRDATGRVRQMRGSSCTDPELQAMPEGKIDPNLRTVAYFSGPRKIVSCHYYATHPMSYYRDGRVSSDFCGLARKRRQQDEPTCTHLYFTGCAGNIAAGKYNDGSAAARVALTQRMYDAIVTSELNLQKDPLTEITWRHTDLLPDVICPPPSAKLSETISGPDALRNGKILRAYWSSWQDRIKRQIPLPLNCLRLNEISVLHLPAELFVEYQLRAQKLRGNHPVAVAAYGDGGPWYIPTAPEYLLNGYETTVAFSEPSIDTQITTAIAQLLA